MAGQWREATAAITVTCATDGNHGRAVAWGAQRCHCRAVIFVHEGVSEGRAAAIAAYGAEVRRVAGTYDNSVRVASQAAAAEGWFVVSDTSWEGYTEVPRAIMQGYRVMADEAAAQWQGAAPTHVFIQGGVGGVAAAVSVQMRAAFAPTPMIVVVEPDRAACLLASAELGERTSVAGRSRYADGRVGVRRAKPAGVAGARSWGAARSCRSRMKRRWRRCGCWRARGLSPASPAWQGWPGVCWRPGIGRARAALGLGAASRVLVFSTEGATDRDAVREAGGVDRFGAWNTGIRSLLYLSPRERSERAPLRVRALPPRQRLVNNSPAVR